MAAFNDIEVTDELIEKIKSQSEKYESIMKEWFDTDSSTPNSEPKYINEIRNVCKRLSLQPKYMEYILENWGFDIAFKEAFLNYDDSKGADFKTFFNRVARNKIIYYAYDYLNVKDRKNIEVEKDYLDRPATGDSDDERTLGDVYCDYNGVSFEEERISSLSESERDIINGFLESLSDNARLFVQCKFVDEMSKAEILNHTKMSELEYKMAFQEYKRKRASYDLTALNQKRNKRKSKTSKSDTTENKQITKPILEVKEENKMTTKEKNKIIATSVRDYLEDVNRKFIRTDLAVQRVQGIWTPEMTGNLITTVLSGYPFPNIICAEDGRSGDMYIIDGGQRTDALNRFANNLVSISKKSEHLEITYDEPEYDENGNIKEGENGFAVVHPVTVNVGGKYFKDLPDELQRIFLKGQVMVEKYLACSLEDMEWHMRRYNNMKPLTASQKGLTYLGMDLSKSVVAVAKESRFFKNFNKYTKLSSRSYLNGEFNRIINEAVMSINFLDNWEKKQTDLNSFLKINGTKEMVSEINSLLDRLVDAGVETVKEMFTAKNSFIWITLFKKFTDLGIEDTKFITFMNEFKETLHEKELNGVTYDILDKKASKDKTTVIAKINHLEGLMRDFFGIDGNTPDDDQDHEEDLDINEETEETIAETNEVETMVETEPVTETNDVIEDTASNEETIEAEIESEEVNEETDEEAIESDDEETDTKEINETETEDNEVSEVKEKKDYPLPRIEDDTIINQPVLEAEWIKKEQDVKKGISPNAEVLRDYVDEYYDNEYGKNVRDMVSEIDAKRMAIEAMLIYRADYDLSLEHMAEHCSKPFVHRDYEDMKEIVAASKEVNYFAENVEDTAVFEDYENYPLLTMLMIYMGKNKQGITYSDEEIIAWLNDLTPRFNDVCSNTKSKTEMFKAIIGDLKEYDTKSKKTKSVKKVNLDF